MLTKFLVFPLLFFLSSNSLYAMKTSTDGLKGILKKKTNNEVREKTKHVRFKDPIESRSGTDWLSDILQRVYIGYSFNELKKIGFEDSFIKKVLKGDMSKIDDCINYLFHNPTHSARKLHEELKELGYSKVYAIAARNTFDKVYVLTRRFLIVDQSQDEFKKKGYPKKVTEKIFELVEHVKEIRKTSKTIGHPRASIKIAKELGYLEVRKKHKKDNFFKPNSPQEEPFKAKVSTSSL